MILSSTHTGEKSKGRSRVLCTVLVVDIVYIQVKRELEGEMVGMG